MGTLKFCDYVKQHGITKYEKAACLAAFIDLLIQCEMA
jgi:hypothetical protein